MTIQVPSFNWRALLLPLIGTSNTDVFMVDVPDAPTSLVSTGLHNGIRFTWTLPANLPPGAEVELWEHTASTPFSSATRIWRGLASEIFIEKQDTTTRYYWTRIRARTGHVSATEPASTGLAGAAAPLVEIFTATDVGPITITKPSGQTQLIAQVLYATFTLAETTFIEVSAQFRLGVTGNPGFTVRAYAFRGIGSTIGASDAQAQKTDNANENIAVIGTFNQAGGITYRAGIAVTIDGSGSEIVDAAFRDITLRVRVLRP